MIDSETLVSIKVITYNSSETVLETLESIKKQTYENIELVITDDCSTDDTIDICKKWINKNSDRFVNIKVITAENNTGIAANCNRGVKACEGKWIKGIAGDDILLENCITSNIEFVNNNKDIEAVFSDRLKFKGTFDEVNFIGKSKKSIFNDQRLSAKDQYELILRGIGCTPTTLFLKKEAIERVGGYDEEFKKIEDSPFLMRLTKSGVKLHYLEAVTAAYRFHDDSITITKGKVCSDFYIDTLYKVYLKYKRDNLPLIERLINDYKYFINYVFSKTIFADFNIINRALHKLFITPTIYYKKFISWKFSRNLKLTEE